LLFLELNEPRISEYSSVEATSFSVEITANPVKRSRAISVARAHVFINVDLEKLLSADVVVTGSHNYLRLSKNLWMNFTVFAEQWKYEKELLNLILAVLQTVRHNQYRNRQESFQVLAMFQ
jgi:hypothetical protein